MNEQVSLFEDIDLYAQSDAQRRQNVIREKLNAEYVRAYQVYGSYEDIPDHTVLICQTDRMKGDKVVFNYYRVVAGHHKTVSGPALHIISAPSEEWPEVPPWQDDSSHGCKWTYPGCFTLWVKREPETAPEVKWADA